MSSRVVVIISPISSLEEFDIPVYQIHTPIITKNLIAEAVQIPLTPRTERLNAKILEGLCVPKPEGELVENGIATKEASDHLYTLKLKSMEVRSAQFADRATKRRQKWLAEHAKNHKILIEFENENPTKSGSQFLQSAMKGDSKSEKSPIKEDGIDNPEEIDDWVMLDETDIVERTVPTLEKMVIDSREKSPESDWDELEDEIQSTQSL